MLWFWKCDASSDYTALMLWVKLLSQNWSPMDTRKWKFAWCSGIFWHTKDFVKSPKLDADAGETQPGSIWWLMMRLWMAHFGTSGQCEAYWGLCVLIGHQFPDSVRSALQEHNQDWCELGVLTNNTLILVVLIGLSLYIYAYIYIYTYIYIYKVCP